MFNTIHYFEGYFYVFVHMEDPSFEERVIIRPTLDLPYTIQCIACELGKYSTQ